MTVESSGHAGAAFGGGAEGNVDLGTTHAGAGGKVDLTLGVTGKIGQTFVFADKKAADELMTAAEHQPVKDAATSFLGPLQGLGSWIADKIDGHSYAPPPADETFLQGGLSVDVKGKTGDGIVTGSGSVGASVLLGIKQVDRGPDAGSKTVYFKVSTDASVKADASVKGSPLSVTAGGSLGGEAVVEITYDKRGRPTSFAMEAGGTFNLENGLGSTAAGKDLPALFKAMKEVRNDSSSGAGKAYSEAHRDALPARGVKVVIAEKTDQQANRKNRGSRGGRPVGFDAQDDKTGTSWNGPSTSSRTGQDWRPATTSTPGDRRGPSGWCARPRRGT